MLRSITNLSFAPDTIVPDFAGPVLLQQILRAMEDVLAPRTKVVTFAVLSLLVRLIACQSSVFSLWYSRRAYERSRGEMITMLYEKTLSRKLIGESALSTKPRASQDEQNSAPSEANGRIKAHGRRSKAVCEPLGRYARLLTRNIWSRFAREKAEQPASIGKIYNLMR